MDRVRSALFSILAPFGMDGATMADFFAGTGSLGIEALSRGAVHADFVDLDALQCANIRANLVLTKLQQGAVVHQMSVDRALGVLSGPYDLVLMDPPYSDPFPEHVVEELDARDLLKPDAIVVVGHSSRVASAVRCGGLLRTQDRRYGDSSLAFYTRNGEERS